MSNHRTSETLKRFHGATSASRSLHQGAESGPRLDRHRNSGALPPSAMESSKKLKKDSPAATEAVVPAPQDAKRRPIETFREGDVSASVWGREVQYKGKATIFFSVSFERSYKDRDGAFRYSKSFGLSDLGKLITVAQRSAEYIQGIQESDPSKEQPA